ncbi:hypothetical protein OG21DRAFT_925017 [Imleria badia]|nr:hypothetical protein OG21DRAFT_925017 [Imleria badia]
MLGRVNSTFEESSTLEGILGELIVPAVKHKELALREKCLVCLGLCCLIARRMALNSFQLFLSQVQSSPEVLKTRVLHIVFDMLMVHDGDFLSRGGVGSERIVEFLLHMLNGEGAEKVQALLCVGLAKLVGRYDFRRAGPEESGGGLFLARYGRESGFETVFGVLLSRVLLFVGRESEADV